MKALTYAMLSKKAYSVKPDIGSIDGTAKAIVETTDDGLTVAFRGTDNIATWLADLDCQVINTHQFGQIHFGFYSAFKSVQNQLDSLGKIDVITGHSEGGALALIYGAYLCANGKSPKAIYSFDPPRLSADPTIQNLLRLTPAYVYRNGNDVVTEVPRLIENWFQFPLIAIGKPAFPFYNIADHEIDNVIKSLK